MNVGSLFSGIGGIELGFERAGFNTSWFVENDEFCQAVLRKHYSEAVIYGDITQVDFRKLSKVDILTGGFPCQDISNAGKKAGIEGSKSSLWKHYLRAISEIRPRYALIENVSALTRRGLDTILCDLASIGYDAEWYCISASSIGAMHRRSRIFILAYLNQERLVDSWIENDADQAKQQTQRNHSLSLSWASRSDICRAPDGLPHGIHRIASLGNAVVPQCAEVFARAIKEDKERDK